MSDLSAYTVSSHPQDDDCYLEGNELYSFFSAAAYHVCLVYGGPEEGGWWYEAGAPVETDPEIPPPIICTSRREAYAAAHSLQKVLDEGPNVGLRPKTSVLSSGVYEAKVTPGLPKPFPDETPFYC
jgi:hypothetical protein